MNGSQTPDILTLSERYSVEQFESSRKAAIMAVNWFLVGVLCAIPLWLRVRDNENLSMLIGSCVFLLALNVGRQVRSCIEFAEASEEARHKLKS
jgi:hypothetical protein